MSTRITIDSDGPCIVLVLPLPRRVEQPQRAPRRVITTTAEESQSSRPGPVKAVQRAFPRLLSFLAVLAFLLTGCGGAGPSQEGQRQDSIAWSACTSVVDSVPNEDCGAGQLVVQRCTAPTDNPDAAACTGPNGARAQAVGTVWCCKSVQS